jgi:hypothetical protein
MPWFQVLMLDVLALYAAAAALAVAVLAKGISALLAFCCTARGSHNSAGDVAGSSRRKQD